MSDNFKRSTFGSGFDKGSSTGGGVVGRGTVGGGAEGRNYNRGGNGGGSGGLKQNIGAVWDRSSKNGNRFLSISIDREKLINLIEASTEGDKVKLVAFENKDRKEEKHPDFRIFESQ